MKSRSSQYDFLVFSDDWGRHPSSCQHIFRILAQKHRVLWVNTIGLRTPKADGFTAGRAVEKFRRWKNPLRKISDNLYVLEPIMLPVMGNSLAGKLNSSIVAKTIRKTLRKLDMHNPILWTTVPNGSDFIGKVSESGIVYYVTDDYSHWPGANADTIQHADKNLAAKADMIFTCTEELGKSYDNSHLLPHAVNFELFSQPQPEPDEIKHIPHPRLCFFGLIYEEIDIEAVEKLASTISELQIILIGPVKTNISRLESLPNVHVLGVKEYHQLPAYLHSMDGFVIPYRYNAEMDKAGPLKIRECLAVGKPVVARRLANLEQYEDVIHLYETHGEFIAEVKQVLRESPAELQEQMQMRVRDDTWSARVAVIESHLDNLIRVTVSTEVPDWEIATGNIFHDPHWGGIMSRVYGNQPYYLTAWRGTEVLGTLQLVHQKSLLFGSHLTSLPYFDSSGILAEDKQVENLLIEEAEKLRMAIGADWVEIREGRILNTALPRRTDKVNLKLDLPDNAVILWENFNPKVRNQIRKAEREKLVCQSGGSEYLDDFYRVYLRNMRDLGSPAHSKKFFAEILRSFGDHIKIFVVMREQNIIASAFTIRSSRDFNVPWAASDYRYRKFCPNMLLYWSMIKSAVADKLSCFNFGRSTRDSGTYKFKKQWGALEESLYWHYLQEDNAEIPALRPDSGKYKYFVRLWKHLPIPLARLLGPGIISKLA